MVKLVPMGAEMQGVANKMKQACRGITTEKMENAFPTHNQQQTQQLISTIMPNDQTQTHLPVSDIQVV